MTETWLADRDLSTLVELYPKDCNFLNCPRTVGQGVVLQLLLKIILNANSCQWENTQSIEVLLCKAELPRLVLCALVYRHHKNNKDFL